MNKREFVPALGGASLGGLAREEDFWATIRAGYRLTPAYINVPAQLPTSALQG